MPKPNEEQLAELGKPVMPFERTSFKRKVLDGESLKAPFLGNIYDATENDYPKDALKTTSQDIVEGKFVGYKSIIQLT